MSQKLKAVDFFCGGGGMTAGMKQAGIEVIAGIDIDETCQATYEANNPKTKFLLKDVKEMKITELETDLDVKRNDDNLVFIGCSPCQYWSIIFSSKKKSEKSKNLLSNFQEFVDYYRPGYIVIENVPGIRKKGSPLADFLRFLKDTDYTSIDMKVVYSCHYGVPQYRKRFVLLASRVKDVRLPSPDSEDLPTVRKFIGDEKKFPKVSAGHKDETGFMHTVAGLQQISLDRLALTPKDGGTRDAWKDTNLQINTYKGKDKAFSTVYGRMLWDKPSQAITTKFYGVSHGRFSHPEQDRAISLREGATLQTFPLNYIFKTTTITHTARLIGNAVPPELARRLGIALLNAN